jgi:hypothetical protein
MIISENSISKLEALLTAQGKENGPLKYLDLYSFRIVNFFVLQEDRNRP